MLDVGADRDEVVAILTPLLKSDPWISPTVGKLLCRVSPAAARQEALRLIDIMAKGDAPVDSRNLYLFALEGLAPHASEAIPVLIPLIDDRDKMVSETAIRTLGEIGPSAAAAVPKLTARLGRNLGNSGDTVESDIRLAEALGKIGPPAQSAVPALLALLEKPHVQRPDHQLSGIRAYNKATIDALVGIGDGSPPVLSALRLQMANESPEFRAAAVEAFIRLGADPKDVLPVLERQLGDENARVRVAVIDALASRAADSQTVLVDLRRHIDDREPVVRCCAILAIGRMNCDRSTAIAALTAALSDDNHYVRSAAAVTLGKIGPEAKSAVPALQQILHEPGNWVRYSRYSPVRYRIHGDLIYAPELADLSIREAARSALSQIGE
jgi:HEAT repeat protein